MKIATFNINGLNARLPGLLKWLADSSPDVACLQELKTPHDKFPLSTIEEAGYKAVWHGQKSWNGVAILAKADLKLQEIGRGLPGDPADEQSRYIEARVDDTIVCCLYLPNGNPAPGPKFDSKMAWMDRLHEKAQALVQLKESVVMLGDYNVIPGDLDAKRPERWVDDALFFPETKEKYQKLLAQGWTDAIRKLYPDEKIFTYWDYFRNAFARDSGIRIDHLLLNPAAAERLEAGAVDRDVRGSEKPSDHAPVWITLK